MSIEKIVSIEKFERKEKQLSADKFSGIVESINKNEVISFNLFDIYDELKAIFGGDVIRRDDETVTVINLLTGEDGDIGRIFNYMYEGRRFSRIEDVLVIALDMAIEQILFLHNGSAPVED